MRVRIPSNKYVNSLCLLSLSDCSELVMYADALVLYKPISTEGDCIDLKISAINRKHQV